MKIVKIVAGVIVAYFGSSLILFWMSRKSPKLAAAMNLGAERIGLNYTYGK